MDSKDTLLSHDVKSERPDVSQGLPNYLKVVPILFFVTIVASIGLGSWFYLGLRSAAREKERWTLEDGQHRQAIKKLETEKEGILEQNQRARDVVAWTEGAQGIQPLSIAITRSIEPTVTVSELKLTRNSEIPAQIYLSMKLDGASQAQLDRTLKTIKDMSYRAYSAQQTKAKETLDYKATLIWQNPNR